MVRIMLLILGGAKWIEEGTPHNCWVFPPCYKLIMRGGKTPLPVALPIFYSNKIWSHQKIVHMIFLRMCSHSGKTHIGEKPEKIHWRGTSSDSDFQYVGPIVKFYTLNKKQEWDNQRIQTPNSALSIHLQLHNLLYHDLVNGF